VSENGASSEAGARRNASITGDWPLEARTPRSNARTSYPGEGSTACNCSNSVSINKPLPPDHNAAARP